VLDTQGTFPAHCHGDHLDVQRLEDPTEIEVLRDLIVWHRKKTQSWRAAQLLAEWSHMQRVFWRVTAHGYAASANDLLAMQSRVE